jgi:hypothetical protein
MSRRLSFPYWLVSVVVVCASVGVAVESAGSAANPALDLRDASIIWSRLAVAARSLATGLEPVTSAIAFLPVRTGLVLRILAENVIAAGEAGRISRRDALWFQAGAGQAGMSYLEGSNLAPPKWSGEYPSIAEPRAAPPGSMSSDVNHFSFQIGR